MSDYDNPEWMECYRIVVQERLELFQQGKINDSPCRLASQYFPDDLERQTDMCMWIGESIGRAEELGYEVGIVPTALVRQIAEKYNMVKIMDLETALSRSGGDTAVLDREVKI